MKAKIILAANRLPATLVKTASGKQIWHVSPGGMAAALTPVQKYLHATWIGWSGVSEANNQLPPFPRNLQGLFINNATYNRYYNAVANGALWPAFHGLTPAPFSQTDWRAYRAVNNQFAKAITATAGPDDLIWVHDFQLLLVPELLRKHGCRQKIGLFLHIPFTGQTWRQVPHITDILRSLLGADLIGVQTARDARHLTQALKQAFPAATLPRITHIPIGIDYGHFHQAASLAATQQHLTAITQQTRDKYVVLSISRLDYTKGIITQLRAIEHAVQHGMQNVIYKSIVAPSREGVGAYQKLRNEIEAEVARLATTIPGVIDYQYKNAPFAQVCAWYARADTLLVTPLVDGMNLVAKEYLAAKPQDQDGVIILSKTAGAAEQMQQALLVNPKNIADIAGNLLRAQAMPASERRQRAAAIRQNLQTQDVFWWVKQFISEIR